MSRLLKLSLGRRQGDRYRGPFAESKEQLGGIVLANNLDHAIELLSKHSGVRLGVRLARDRPADEEVSARVAAREPWSQAAS